MVMISLVQVVALLPPAYVKLVVSWAIKLFSMHSLNGAYSYIYASLLLKSGAVILLNQDFMAPYRWLDCYLAGRFQVSARVPEASKLIIVITLIYQMAARIYLCALSRRFRLPLIEFTMVGTEERVAQWNERISAYLSSGGELHRAQVESTKRMATSTQDDLKQRGQKEQADKAATCFARYVEMRGFWN